MITNSTGVLPAVQNATNVSLWYRSFAVFLVLTITSQNPLLTRITSSKILLTNSYSLDPDSPKYHFQIQNRNAPYAEIRYGHRDRLRKTPVARSLLRSTTDRQISSNPKPTIPIFIFSLSPCTRNTQQDEILCRSVGRSNKIGTTRQ